MNGLLSRGYGVCSSLRVVYSTDRRKKLSVVKAEHLDEWIAIPVDDLPSHSRIPLTLVDEPGDVHRQFADDVWQDINSARSEGREISLILPLGPTGQFPVLAERINEAQMSLEHVTFFGMDEWLDWQGRPFNTAHPYSLVGRFRRLFLDLIDEDLRPPQENVIFPTPLELDRPAQELERRGNLMATYGGVGFQGHLAFNEAPGSRWTSVSLRQLRESRTRLVPIAVDSIIAHAQRSAGGNVFAVPPMAVTLGMSELLSAPRIRLYIDTGAWKRTILRILLFSEPDVDYPVTLVREHPDVRVVVDRQSAVPPLPSASAEAEGAGQLTARD
jgi:glucosamine-6-phosphate deaminase